MKSITVAFLLVLGAVIYQNVDGVTQCYHCSLIDCSDEDILTCEDPDSLCVSNTYMGVVGQIHQKTCVNSSSISSWQNDVCPHYNSGGGSCYLCDTDLCNLLD
ncbi:hypothetical protein MTP99_010566 [Tenebrio molitor]|nr:hypothetical protein MTP99_010566 [Tenebrio molitor]CAH1369072.1 unnamed protein product [Tenebrio molitor]